MAGQINEKIPASLQKIGKKKRKFLLKRMKDVNPEKLEEILQGKTKDKQITFKNKSNKKKKKVPVKKPAILNAEQNGIPKDSDKFSSNWEGLKTVANKEESVIKEKQIFYRRNKSGQLITNAPALTANKGNLKKTESVEESENTEDIWFDDVDPMLLDSNAAKSVPDALVKSNSFQGITKVLGMDCEMVGVGTDGSDSILARVSIVNHFGHPVYDKFVKPREKVTDYRTAVSGVRPEDLVGAPEFVEVQQEVSDIIKGRLLVGHALRHDLKVLFLDHPKKLIRDTSKYKPFKNAFGGRTPSLKNLSAKFLGVTVQTGEHSSVQDSQAAVRLYTMFRKEWEDAIKKPKKNNKTIKKSTKSEKKITNEELQSKEMPKTDRVLYCPSDSD